MLRTPDSASRRSRRSISSTALRRALVAFLGSVITGVSRCGMPSYIPNSTRLGSTMIRRTSSGVALYRIPMIMELIMTLLPDPVDPAISKCGIASSEATLMRPLMSLPSGMVRCECDCENSSDSSICLRAISSRRVLGTSTPTVGLPGMRSIRMDLACRPRQRSSPPSCGCT